MRLVEHLKPMKLHDFKTGKGEGGRERERRQKSDNVIFIIHQGAWIIVINMDIQIND